MGGYVENEIFSAINFTQEELGAKEYEQCEFVNCSFFSCNLSGFTFIECVFCNCDFSTVKVVDTSFRDIEFVNCKLLGLHFANCNTFLLSFNFDGCVIDYSIFGKLKIRKTIFKNCSLKEVDFSETDLTGSTFDNCNLEHAVFSYSKLEKVDFRSAYNFSIHPDNVFLKKTRFSKEELKGLLGAYDIIID